ncbi:MAG: hypothetical protein PF439_10440 [Helicobacteraceae bacterium]|jgi:hypothetical protein|nr:hypothetical protein [Helicobacteraceae bacterium]
MMLFRDARYILKEGETILNRHVTAMIAGALVLPLFLFAADPVNPDLGKENKIDHSVNGDYFVITLPKK